MFTSPATPEGEHHLAVRITQDAAAVGVAAGRDAMPHQAGMQVDRVRHHGGADDADRQQQALGAGQLRHHGMECECRPVGRGDRHLDDVADADDADETGDHHLDQSKAAALQRQDRQRHDEGDQQPDRQAQAEQQRQADRGAQRFGKVGRHRGDLADDPHGQHQRAREMRAAEFRQAVIGDDADLGGQRLEQHRQNVGEHDDPQQQIAELRAALDVGREIARIDIGDRGDDRRPRERQEAAHAAPPPGQRLTRRVACSVGQRVRCGSRHAPCTIDHTVNLQRHNVA